MPLRVVLWLAVSSKKQADDDKISLPYQEELGRKWASDNHAQIVDILSIRGHSRSETDIFTLFEDYASIGEPAYHKLRQHWRDGDFDVLWAFHYNRLGRSFSIQALLLENCVKQPRRAFFHQGGWVDVNTVDNFIALGGMSTKSESKYRTQMTQKGMEKRFHEGLHMHKPPLTHRAVRNERGKAVCLEVRDDRLPMLNALADLLLAGIGWGRLPQELGKLGYLTDVGKQYAASVLRRMMYGPFTWGINARYFDLKEGLWSFDESVPLPEGVVVERNPNPAIPPVWVGERAKTIQAELRRRMNVVSGRSAPNTKFALTGLLLCAGCSRRMSVQWTDDKQGKRRYYWCCSYTKNYANGRCAAPEWAKDPKVKQQIDRYFARLEELEEFDIASLVDTQVESKLTQIKALKKSIATCEKRLTTLITQQADAPPATQSLYAKQITELSQQWENQKKDLVQLEASLETPSSRESRLTATRSILSNREIFWNQEPREINQALHQAMGSFRFLVKGGEIVDVCAEPKRIKFPRK